MPPGSRRQTGIIVGLLGIDDHAGEKFFELRSGEAISENTER